MAVVLLTAANQLPALMAHNHYFADVRIVFLEGILKQQAVGTDEQAVITVLVSVFGPVIICGQLTGALRVGTTLQKKMLIQVTDRQKVTQYG